MSGTEQLLAAARQAVDAAQNDPNGALSRAVELLAEPRLPDIARATAHWAAGLATRETGDLAAAQAHLTAAAQLAAGLDVQLTGRVRVTRALVLAYLGRAEEGLAELDEVQPLLDAVGQGHAEMQRALILTRLGRLDEAIDGYRLALPALVAGGDRVVQVRLLVNRGIALTYRNRLAEADTDLVAARSLARELGQAMQVAACSHNLGFLHGRRGDIPRSLAWFDRADAEYAALGVNAGLRAVLLSDRAEVLLDAGLVVEAKAAAERALQLLSAGSNSVQVAEARLVLAQAAQAVGDWGLAAREAAAAFDAFSDQQRASWATRARYLLLAAGRPERLDDVVTATDIDDLATDLDAAGWSLEAATTRVIAGRRALTAGDPARAQRLLAPVADARSAGGTAVYRAVGWYAQALRLLAADRRTSARRAIRTGLGLLDDYRATLGAADLRAHAAAHGERLAGLLVSLAVDGGRAGTILAAAESWRAGGVAVAALPPRDPRLAELLSARRARAALRRTGAIAEPDLETARLEAAIRDLVRALPVTGGPSPGDGPAATGADASTTALDAASQPTAAPFDRAAVVGRLGTRMLVEFVVHERDLLAVWLVDGRTEWRRLGRLKTVVPVVERMRQCLHRLSWGGGSARSLVATAAALRDAAAVLDRLLFGEIAGAAERELVIVPTGPLHGVPWSALPTVRQAPCAVAPSARSWLAADSAPRRPVSLLAAAGPDLPGAAAEVADVARLLPGCTVLDPQAATVAAVLDELGRVSIAHLATHATFRADNPQFSALALADGDLTVYDLNRLPAVPQTLVIAACDTAVSAVRPGDELLGVSAALLSLGACSIVAPLLPVPDTATRSLMVELERRLLAGERAPAALHGAITAVGGDAADGAGDPAIIAATGSFVVLGS